METVQTNIKKNSHIIIAALIIAAALLWSGNHKDKNYLLQNENQETISISGEAEQFVAPDTASVSFSMTRKSRVLSEASDSVNQRIGDLVKDLKKQGIQESDVKTTNYNVNPQYNYNNGQQTFDGYRVSQSVQITIKDLDNVEAVLSQVATYEVDNVSGLSFFIFDDKKIKDNLREMAIDDAKEKAKRLAHDLGIELKHIVGFTESGNNYYPQPVYRSFDFAEAAFEDSVSASIPTGENEIRSDVTITYKISR